MTVHSKKSLYDPRYEHDACGLGFLANLTGKKSHSILEKGIEVLENLLHRGATGSDPNTGDGAGLLFQIPDAFFRAECDRAGIPLPKPGEYGVGMFFLPAKEDTRKTCRATVEKVVSDEGLEFLGWRNVPISKSALGKKAREEMPFIAQCFVGETRPGDRDLERTLYVVRRQIERAIADRLPDGEIFYIPSFSACTIVYKGLMLPGQVSAFYQDLRDTSIKSAAVIVHQRYSTNTFPSWALAQPFRYLAHNGEINTLKGNINWMRAREKNLQSKLFGSDIKKLFPIVQPDGSDSACLDNALELLTRGGRSVYHSMMMLIPEAWGDKYPMGPDLRGFFEYHAGIMEPWDGPAAVAFMDKHHIGALLDRNGLRPSRYTVTRDDFIVFASEAGVLDIPPEDVIEKGALRPGEMLLVDFEKQRLIKGCELKMRLARQQPYRRWVEENKITVHGFFDAVMPIAPDSQTIMEKQLLFGYTREDIDMILGPMAASGSEPTGSMGADQPLAVLSERPQLLYWYFKQVFAQVTNPAIDPIREELVMSLMTFLGMQPNILTESPGHSHLIKLRHPILSNDDLHRIQNLNLKEFSYKTLKMEFPAKGSGKELEGALEKLCTGADEALTAGYKLLILSDKNLTDNMVPIPALLAVSAVNQHLTTKGTRTSVGLIVETGEAREVMHIAALLGYGASAINPYLAFEIVAHLALTKRLGPNIGVAKAIENYVKALCKGLLKIMSKIGISTLRSYRNAQVFEAVGIRSDVIDTYFSGTASRIGGIGLDEIAREALERFSRGTNPGELYSPVLPSGGQYRFRQDGERHLWNPDSISLLQHATRNCDFSLYRQYATLINDQNVQLSTIRGLFRFKKSRGVPLSAVEPASNIVKRFVTGAMSFGSISKEAHETLAIAMNRLGGMSNSGEGGEDSARFKGKPGGDQLSSAVKQVASGRFGVTAEYLASGREIQIKISQGAKPGEGGQLPGDKVNVEIARVRKSTPGVTLISPPPHHDIYSIEDIAQLIYDLKCANSSARISVKLVSEVGVGTVAAGVAKAHAEMILISGYDGGTGAAPLSSIKHTGVPWELGLSETQQTLILNGLRSRVRLQVDGQLRTGRDVVIGALLGAEEFGFATAALIVCGCVMMRKCHNNTCPVGIATQDPELRKFYSGKPEYVVNFFNFVAEEVREIMADLGFTKFDDMIGRSDIIEIDDAVHSWKTSGIDLSRILHHMETDSRRHTIPQEYELHNALDNQILKDVARAIENGEPKKLELPIRNVNRAVGTIISSHIAKKYGGEGLPDDTIDLTFTGAAGQSFGAFCSKGMTLRLLGEANDYLGKGLSGGKIIVLPDPGSRYEPSENTIAGNVLLYGATSGEVYINGRVGERFAVRNSGVYAVVEGIGDHGCEYMTRGRIVILGATGVNFGAGMSGGIAYVYDETGMFDNRCNLEMIDLELVTEQDDVDELHALISNHHKYTLSKKAEYILGNFDKCLPYFVKVFPMEYKRVLGRMSKEDEAIKREEMGIL